LHDLFLEGCDSTIFENPWNSVSAFVKTKFKRQNFYTMNLVILWKVRAIVLSDLLSAHYFLPALFKDYFPPYCSKFVYNKDTVFVEVS
jgi:hypothetical protein